MRHSDPCCPQCGGAVCIVAVIAEPPAAGLAAALCGAPPDRSGFTLSPSLNSRLPAPNPPTGCFVAARQVHPARLLPPDRTARDG
jgi:hypothetical protein